MAEEIEEAKLIYEDLKKKGYLVYYCRVRIEQKRLIKVQVGIFDNVSEAEKFGEEFKKQEGFDYFVETALVNVDEFKDRFKIVTTLLDMWFTSDDLTTKIYTFERQKYKSIRNEANLNETIPHISPDGKSIVFYYDCKIIKVTIEDESTSVLLDHIPDRTGDLLRSFPQWAPSGKYIAFIDENDLETLPRLWLMSPDGIELKCLIDKRRIKNAVKYFLWHPTKDEIFFVEGYGMGTVHIGGNLYSIDLKGNRKEIVVADRNKREEIFWKFKIFGNILIYQIAHFDEQWNYREFTTHEINLSYIK